MQVVLERAELMDGIEQVVLTVTATQTAAVRLYRSLGFRAYGREPKPLRVGGERFDEQMMVRFAGDAGRKPDSPRQ